MEKLTIHEVTNSTLEKIHELKRALESNRRQALAMGGNRELYLERKQLQAEIEANREKINRSYIGRKKLTGAELDRFTTLNADD